MDFNREMDEAVFESKFNWVAVKLVAAISFVFVLQVLYPPLTGMFAEVPVLVIYQPWRVVTHIFLHGGIEHLFYNMFALALFGTILEKVIGWRRFLSLFFAAGIIASIGSIITAFLFRNPSIGSVGASGAIFGVIGTLAILRPRMIVYFGFFPMPMVAAAVFYALIDIVGLFNPFSPIDNSAHLFGMFFGIIFALLLREKFGEPLFVKKRSADIRINEEEFEDWEERWMGRKKKRR